MSFFSKLGQLRTLFGGGSSTSSNVKSFRDSRAADNPNSFSAHNKQLEDALNGSFKKGGKVKKTGIYRLHKGERVLNVKQTMAYKMGKR